VARTPEQQAWTVLMGSFITFCVILLSLLLGGQWWLTHAKFDQTIRMSRSGTVLVTPPERTEDVANPAAFPVGSIVRTEAGAQATLNFIEPDGQTVLATLTLYGDTKIRVTQADSPRFNFTDQPHHIRIDVEVGRVRATVGVNTSRAVQIELRSAPQTWTSLQTPGSNVSVEATPTQTRVTVREGQALISSLGQGQGIVLNKDERAEVGATATINGPLPAERNLITNGDFSTPLEQTWAVDVRPPGDPNEEPGMVERIARDGRWTVELSRPGNNTGWVGLSQHINLDIQDFKSLKLRLDVLIVLQDLYNCGAAGSECPLIVKIDYVDPGQGVRGWLQGFYYNANTNPAFGLTTCPGCAEKHSEHLQVPLNQWHTFESPNLIELFQQTGHPAIAIKSITLYASGHTFDSFVTDIQLLGAE
jgi:hypothetical protein